MAMTKEEQRASAERIMEKMGPLDEVERLTYELLTRRPEEYIAPDPETGERVCGVCGEVFQRIPGSRETPEVSALEQFSDHQSEHNPTSGQWLEAHRKIQAGKESQKGREG